MSPPTAAGFGTTMLNQAIAYQHRGRVELDWRTDGLVCRLALPLTKAATAAAARAPDRTPPRP